MKLLVRLLSLLLIITWSCSCTLLETVETQRYQETIEAVRETGTNLIVQMSSDVTAVSIAVMHEGTIIHSEGFGKRDIEQDLSVDKHTHFNIGSISKTFTAAAILLLQQDGKFDLDDSVADLLPEFSMADEAYRDITVRMLLNHTSGMPGTDMRSGFATERLSNYLDQTFALLEESALKHAPGDYGVYCNDGFTVAQALIERYANMPYEQFLRQRIWKPLGMDDTYLGFMQNDENMAFAYADKTIRLPVEYVNIMASGGITSTAEDLCRYAALTFVPGILDTESLDEFIRAQNSDVFAQTGFDKRMSFGLGWDFTDWEPYRQASLKVLGKTGGTVQYTAMLFVIPETKSAVALVCSGHCNPINATLPIVDALIRETDQASLADNQEEIATGFEPLPQDYTLYEGYYGSADTLHMLEFDEDSSTLVDAVYDGSSFEPACSAVHIGNGIYASEDGNRYACRTIDGTPAVLTLVAPYVNAEISMTRIPERSTIVHSFKEAVWLPINFTPSDLVLQLFSTSFLDELPGYVLLNKDNTVPYAITETQSSEMVLPSLRDQYPPRYDEDGLLKIGSYRCIDSDHVRPLLSGEHIVAGTASTVEWRKMAEYGRFSCEVPPKGRIIVLGFDFSTRADTLYEQQQIVEVEAAAYVAFIAEAQVEFEPTFVKVQL